MGSYTDIKFKELDLFANKSYMITYNGFGWYREQDKIEHIWDEDEEEEKYYKYHRPLRDIIPHLDLMGHTLEAVEKVLKKEINPDITNQQFIEILKLLNFEEYIYKGDYDRDLGDYCGWVIGEYIADNPEALKKTKELTDYYNKQLNEGEHEDEWYPIEVNLNPFLIMRLLGEIEEYADEEIIWDFTQLLNGGYVDESEINLDGVCRKYWILTEGKTDRFIIKTAMEFFQPELSRYFNYIDSDDHPFGGTKELGKFLKGLRDIEYSKPVIALLDNDTIGNKELDGIQQSDMPKHFTAEVLPHLKLMESYPADGPTGVNNVDINGKAVTIECFLDLDINGKKPPIKWTSWENDIQQYQGQYTPDIKGRLIQKFKNAASNNFTNYDTDRLEILINFIISKAIALNK